MKDHVTLTDIARICKVSVSTVSKALNDKADISDEKKEEIKQIARKLGYVPNFMAATLKSKKTRNIGVLLSEHTGTNLMHEHFARILNSFKDTIEDRGYFITFLNTRNSPNRLTYAEQCKYFNIDGVFILCADYQIHEVKELTESNLPIVSIDHVFPKHVNIASNHYGDMKRMMEMIFYRGHRKIAFIHGENNEVTAARVKAYKEFMALHQLPVPREYLYTCPYRDYERSSALTKAVLALSNRPSFILYPDDLTAVSGLNMMQEAGMIIPRDMSIAGYDGLNLTKIVRPRIATIKQDTEAMGIQAGNKLINRIESFPEDMDSETVIVDGMIEPGDSISVINPHN